MTLAITPMSNVFKSPILDGSSEHPHGTIMELIRTTDTDGAQTFTMGTDSDHVGLCSYAFPMVYEADGTPCSISGLGTTVILNATDNIDHDVYLFGGKRFGSNIFCLSGSVGEAEKKPGVVWEIVKVTLASGGTGKVVCATHHKKINVPLFVLPIQVLSAAGDAGGCAVNEISTIDYTLECGSSALVLAALVGGYQTAIADNATDVAGSQRTQPIYLKPIEEWQPGDLICEIIDKTLDGSSPSTVTITAADDCQKIRHIEMVLPVCANATEYALAWSGTQGKTSAIYGQNAKSDVTKCLVMGK